MKEFRFDFGGMRGWYKLVGREVVALKGVPGVGEGFDSDRHVRVSITAASSISTVFLCLDHNFFGEGPPLLFETMVFERSITGLKDDEPLRDVGHDFGVMDRYATYDEAEAGHQKILDRILELERLAIELMPARRREVFERAQREAESVDFTMI